MIFEADPEFVLLDYDISAFYPSLMDTNGWRPRHLPAEFHAEFHDLIMLREAAVQAAKAYKVANSCVTRKDKIGL